MAKATKREMYQREEDIHAAIKQGLNLADFCEGLADKHGTSVLSIERQYQAIIANMVSLQKDARGELRIKLMMRNDEIFKKSMSKQNYKDALNSLNLQAKIGGLYETEKTNEDATDDKTRVFNFVQTGTDGLSVVPKPGEDDGE